MGKRMKKLLAGVVALAALGLGAAAISQGGSSTPSKQPAQPGTLQVQGEQGGKDKADGPETGANEKADGPEKGDKGEKGDHPGAHENADGPENGPKEQADGPED